MAAVSLYAVSLCGDPRDTTEGAAARTRSTRRRTNTTKETPRWIWMWCVETSTSNVRWEACEIDESSCGGDGPVYSETGCVRNHTDTHSHSHKRLHAPRRARTWAVYVSRLTPEFFNQFCSGGCRGSRPSSEPSSSVRGCGENLGLAPRLASRHYHKAAASSALVDWRTRGAQIHGKPGYSIGWTSCERAAQ